MATIYTSDSLRNLFQSSFNLAQWYSFLQYFFNASELKEKPERIIASTSDEGYYLGNINTSDSYRIGLFHYNIRQGSVANKLVGLRNLVKSFINPTWGEFDAALVVFDSGDHWRLSFICDIKGEATSPKRYTYVFGSDDLLYRTPIERFNFLKKKGISFENLRTAFSVEALSDEFFDKYREQYADFIQYVTGKRFVKVGSKWEEKILGEPDTALMQAFNHNEKKIRDYVKKMMGRITFLHFLQRKGWMCGDLNYMQNMFENSQYKDDFFKPKVMWKIIGCNINFSFNDGTMICNNAVNIMTGQRNQLLQFLGLMNCKLFDWYLKLTTEAEVQGGGIQLYVTTLEKTLVKLDFPMYLSEVINQRVNGIATDTDVDNIIFEAYKLTQEEIDYILSCKQVDR